MDFDRCHGFAVEQRLCDFDAVCQSTKHNVIEVPALLRFYRDENAAWMAAGARIFGGIRETEEPAFIEEVLWRKLARQLIRQIFQIDRSAKLAYDGRKIVPLFSEVVPTTDEIEEVRTSTRRFLMEQFELHASGLARENDGDRTDFTLR